MDIWKGTVPVQYVRLRGKSPIDLLRSAAAWLAENHVTDLQDFVLRDTDGGDYEALLYYATYDVGEVEEQGEVNS